MYYQPQYMIDAFNNAITCLYVITGALVFIVFLWFCSSIHPEPMQKLRKWIRRFLGIERVVKTVYSDKSKNYSGTEFLPVPMKAPTESFTYEFLGWNKFSKDKNGKFEVQPIFLKKVKTCIVNVYDEKDNLLETHEVQYGAGISITHKKIIKEPTKEFEYEFVGWDKDLTAFFENTEIRPIFKANPIKFNYKFVMDDGKTIVLDKKAIVGTPINCPNAPAKIDDDYVYNFVEWKGYKRGMILDKDYVFEAIFDKKLIENQDEKIKNQKKALEVVVNDYKPKKKKGDEEYQLQDKQSFKTSKNIDVEKNKSKTSAEKPKQKETIKQKSLLNGVIVEKNKAKKSKTK